MDRHIYTRDQLRRIWDEDDRNRYGDQRRVREDYEREHDEAAANVGQLSSLCHRQVKVLHAGLALVLRINHIMGKYQATAELRHATPIEPSGTMVRYSNGAHSRGHETREAAVAMLPALESEVMANAQAVTG